MDTYFKFNSQSLKNYLYSIGAFYGYDKQGKTFYASDLEQMRQKGLITQEFPIKNILSWNGILGYIRECPDSTWLAHHCSTEIEIFGFANELYAVLYLYQLDDFQDPQDEMGDFIHFPWEKYDNIHENGIEPTKSIIDPIIICSVYKNQIRKIKSIGNTKIFSNLQDNQKAYLSDLILIEDNEQLLIISIINDKEWLVLSDRGVYYSVENVCNSIKYCDILDCSLDRSKILIAGHSAYSEVSWIVIITSINGEEKSLKIFDNLHIVGIITSLIRWLSLHAKASIYHE
jgi:hypothetical protein